MRSKPELSEWTKAAPPLYRVDCTWEVNLELGPQFSGPLPHRSDPKETIDFLGYSIGAPIGVFAGPLLDQRWVQIAGKLGFDVLTYKTIRNRPQPSHPLPNITYIEADAPFDPEHLPDTVTMRPELPQTLETLGITNSFGNPSMDSDYLYKDIRLARDCIAPWQVLVVSVFGTPHAEVSLIDDFCRTTQLAKESGAQVIEANYSCPNVSKGLGSLYLDLEASEALTRALVAAAAPLPLVVKVGCFPNTSMLRSFLQVISRAGARGVCGINTVSAKVQDAQGNPALGPKRPTSGVCGSPIRLAALNFVEQSATIIRDDSLDLTLMGGGGITKASQFDEFLNLGADIALTATGMMWDPLLALRYLSSKTLVEI